MADGLMDRVRHALGLPPSSVPSMNDEQATVAERLRRIAQRQKAIDMQVDVLRADKADAKHAHR